MWYEGFPMAQTLNTCLYLYNPDVVPDPTLKAFIRATLQRCDLVREVVLRADLYEVKIVDLSYLPWTEVYIS
jgi:hypothetical protein